MYCVREETSAYATAETGEGGDRGERVRSVVESVGVEHVAVVLLGEAVGPQVDPVLDEDGACDGAHADAVQKNVVFGVVYQTRVGNGSHFRGGGAGLDACRVDGDGVNHRHEELVGVDEDTSGGSNEKASDSEAGELRLRVLERNALFRSFRIHTPISCLAVFGSTSRTPVSPDPRPWRRASGRRDPLGNISKRIVSGYICNDCCRV